MFRFTCPTCRNVLEVPSREDAPCRPFCSDRCQRIDLAKWFSEEYVISDPLPQPAQPSVSEQSGADEAER